MPLHLDDRCHSKRWGNGLWQVADGLFLATNAGVSDLATLQSANLSHIVNCAAELSSNFPQQFDYLRLELNDPDDSLGALIKGFCEFIDRGRQAGSVVVHCHGAISRSPAVILAYLCYHGQSLRQAAQHLGAIVATLPNDIFFWQIAKYFGEQLTSATLREILVTLGQMVRCQHPQGGK